MRSRSGPRGEAVAVMASVALFGAVLAPAREHWRARPHDSFPFSCYPMFTAKRSATGTVTHLVGMDRQGQTRVLAHGLLGPGGLNQVRRQLRRTVREGRAEVTCRRVADRVSATKDQRYDDVVEVRVVTGTYRFRRLLHRRLGSPSPPGPCLLRHVIVTGVSSLRRLQRFWFRPAPAMRLAVLRVAVGGYSLWYLSRRTKMLERIAAGDPALFRPTGVVGVLHHPLPVPVVKAATVATVAANVAFLLGWHHRRSGPAFAGLLLWTLSYRNSWSMIYHSDNVLVLHAVVLGLVPAADALSVDARRWVGPRRTAVPPAHGRYGWPVNLMNAVTASTYLVAGVAKLKGPLGWRWADGRALRGQVAMDGLRKELFASRAAPLGTRIYHRVGLYRALAVGSLVIELAAPLVLPSRRWSRLWAAGAFVMHWGIYAVMGIKFRYQLSAVMFASFFDVERLAPLVSRLAGRREK